VVEDACQAHGPIQRQKSGALGRAGCFSFIQERISARLGEAGGVTTDDKELAARIQIFRDHGQHKKYYHSRVGWTPAWMAFKGRLEHQTQDLDVNNVRRHRTDCFTTSFWPTRRRSLHLLSAPQAAMFTISMPFGCRNGIKSSRRWRTRGISCGFIIHSGSLARGHRFWAAMKVPSRWRNVARKSYSPADVPGTDQGADSRGRRGTQIMHQCRKPAAVA